MDHSLVYLFAGAALMVAVLLPLALKRVAVSAPMVLLAVGALLGLLPLQHGVSLSPLDHQVFVEHLTEFCVVVALMGVGLALDRPLQLRSWSTWRSWRSTWRLLAVAMPLTIAATALLGWWAMGLPPAAAMLLGAVLAPTDPVLASDVQVEGPNPLEEQEEVAADDELRFALTSEAGLNDGLAFPFVYAAIFLASVGTVAEWGARWLAWELLGKVLVGVVVGAAVGWALARLAFRSPVQSLRLAETGEPLLVLAAVLLSYGAAEFARGYGFLAVFACAVALRNAERNAEYHVHMHQTIERLERLLTLVILLLLGVALTNGLLAPLTWQGAVVGVALLLVVRPLAGWVSLVRYHRRPSDPQFGPDARALTAFFGVRGIGSLYYLAYGTGEADFTGIEELWATVAFIITLSVVVHGITATPAMRWLARAPGR